MNDHGELNALQCTPTNSCVKIPTSSTIRVTTGTGEKSRASPPTSRTQVGSEGEYMSPVTICTILSGILTILSLAAGMREMNPKSVKLMRILMMLAALMWTMTIGTLLERAWLN